MRKLSMKWLRKLWTRSTPVDHDPWQMQPAETPQTYASRLRDGVLDSKIVAGEAYCRLIKAVPQSREPTECPDLIKPFTSFPQSALDGILDAAKEEARLTAVKFYGLSPAERYAALVELRQSSPAFANQVLEAYILEPSEEKPDV